VAASEEVDNALLIEPPQENQLELLESAKNSLQKEINSKLKASIIGKIRKRGHGGLKNSESEMKSWYQTKYLKD
jgi:Trp operon repressor